MRPATTAADAELQQRYLAAFVDQLYMVGVPRALGRRMRTAPSVAVTFEVEEVFAQTPGPGAGRRLEAAS